MPQTNVYTLAIVDNLPVILYICPDCNGLSTFQSEQIKDARDLTTAFLLFSKRIFPNLIWEYQKRKVFVRTMVERGTLEIGR